MIDWDLIISRDGHVVWRTAWRILANHADTDEVFQEAFLAALEYTKRSTVQNWPALLTRLATARAVDRLRHRQRRCDRFDHADVHTVPSASPQPFEMAEASELSERLREALATLPSRQAEVFCLHCLDGWSYQQIASHMEMSADNVGVQLHRARARLRELLAERQAKVEHLRGAS